jgi:hypothetical protein
VQRKTAYSHDWPSAREINLIPSKELLAICIADRGIDIVVVNDRPKARVSEDAPVKISALNLFY